MIIRSILGIWVLAMLCHPSNLSADIIFQHEGNANPTTEGWTHIDSGIGATAGSVTNDQGSGIDAWFTDDDGLTGQSFEFYNQTPTSSQIVAAGSLGWTLRARVRVVDIPDAVDFSVFAGYRDGSTEWEMIFGSKSNGDPVVRLSTGPNIGPEYILEGSQGGYHSYDLVYDPITSSADLFVDGIERISNYFGRTDGLGATVHFGAGQSDTTGRGNWNQVQWEVKSIPEPCVATLILVCSLVTMVRRSKRNKS